MTEKRRIQYEIRYELDNYVCQKCSVYATHIAHRIANEKVNRKKYGKEVIDHNFNIVSVCSSKGKGCNDSYNIGNKPNQCKKLVELIIKQGDERLSTVYINNYIKG